MNHIPRLLAVGLILGMGCSKSQPTSPTPTATPIPTASPNQPPTVHATITPEFGVTSLTPFNLRVEASDPDAEAVTVNARVCGSDVTIPLNDGTGELTFIPERLCPREVLVIASDSRGATTRQAASFKTFSLNGPFVIIVKGVARTEPSYFPAVLQQTGTVFTGRLSLPHPVFGYGPTDPAQPGRIDADGTFAVRFTIPSPWQDLQLRGRLTAVPTSLFDNSIVGSGVVIGPWYAGKTFELWVYSQY